jgi:NTP pyrophosphatase (non-canonical NTP hydrolase)
VIFGGALHFFSSTLLSSRWSLNVCTNREKFVQFEAYAEKLSTEAVELRNKINKEQRESRRLTSLVTMTAQEKLKLQIREFLSPVLLML